MSEDKPWLNYDKLLRLEQKHDTYAAMADELGCHSNTVRKHLSRAHDQADDESTREVVEEDSDRGPEICVRCEENETPGGSKTGNTFCPECLDDVRHDE